MNSRNKEEGSIGSQELLENAERSPIFFNKVLEENSTHKQESFNHLSLNQHLVDSMDASDKQFLEQLDVFSSVPTQPVSSHIIPSFETVSNLIEIHDFMGSSNFAYFQNSENDHGVSTKHPEVFNELDRKSLGCSMIFKANLFKMALGADSNIIPALSKPAFCPSGFDSMFVCGTEEQSSEKKSQNHLIFATISNLNVSVKHTLRLADHVRDVHWIGDSCVVVAINQKLALFRLNEERSSVNDIVMFPEFHKDTVREIAINSNNGNLVISGGFDGNVFVTDISRLVSDIRNNEKKSENSLYPCRDVVGSVSWHPEDAFLASCTTDTGMLHIFDVRTDKKRPAIVFDSSKKGLYCHSYQNATSIFLGFGDGSIHVFDTRYRRNAFIFQDPFQEQIGEIRFDYLSKTKIFAVFGCPEFSLWSCSDSNILLRDHYRLADLSCTNADYKTSGAFRTETLQIGVTDSNGYFSLFDYAP